MMKQLSEKLPPSLQQGRCAFEGKRFSVYTSDFVGRQGGHYQREAIAHPGAAAILPLVDEEHLVMIRHYRFCVDKELWELPAGVLEPGEEPLESAKRELEEETGYRAKKMELLLPIYTTPGICTEEISLFVATGLHYVGQRLEECEELTVHTFSWKEVLAMAKKGEISDGKTLIALLFYHSFYR